MLTGVQQAECGVVGPGDYNERGIRGAAPLNPSEESEL